MSVTSVNNDRFLVVPTNCKSATNGGKDPVFQTKEAGQTREKVVAYATPAKEAEQTREKVVAYATPVLKHGVNLAFFAFGPAGFFLRYIVALFLLSPPAQKVVSCAAEQLAQVASATFRSGVMVV